MSRTRPKFGQAKSKEFANEKAWREQRVTRKSLHNPNERTHQPSLKSELSHQRHLQNHVVAEWNHWQNEGDDYSNYMSDSDNGDITECCFQCHVNGDIYESQDYRDWIYKMEAQEEKQMKLKHEWESANEFVDFIHDVLGGKFHAQEFVRPALESELTEKTVATFRIVIPDTTPRTSHEVWITHIPRRPKYGRGPPQLPTRARSIRLFRSKPKTLGAGTLLNFLDGVLNEIVHDLFEMSWPSSLAQILSSFCNASVLEIEPVAECCLTIRDGDCKWIPDGPGDLGPSTCHGDHGISMAVSAHLDCDEEYWEMGSMSRQWEEMGVHVFGQPVPCKLDECSTQRSRHVKTTMRLAWEGAVSWDEAALGMVMLPYKEEPFRM